MKLRISGAILVALLATFTVERCTMGGGGVRLAVKVEIDQPVATPSQPAVIAVTVTNVGRTRATWGPGSSTCQLFLAVRVDGEDLPLPGGGRVCTMDLRTYVLHPGDSRTEVLAWDGTVPRGDSGERTTLEPGVYEVRGLAQPTARSAPILVAVEPDP